MQQSEKFDVWALIELFGHSRIAGRVTERNLGGAAFLQVDVPENGINPPFTRLLNPSAIYAINPLDEQTARHYAENLNVAPINVWDVKRFMEKANQNKAMLSAASEPMMDDDRENDRED
jgi:hypothetical protein